MTVALTNGTRKKYFQTRMCLKAVRTFELREEHIRAVGRAYGAVPAEGQTEMTGLDQGLWSVAVLPSVMCGRRGASFEPKKGSGVGRND